MIEYNSKFVCQVAINQYTSYLKYQRDMSNLSFAFLHFPFDPH